MGRLEVSLLTELNGEKSACIHKDFVVVVEQCIRSQAFFSMVVALDLY